MSPHLTRIIRLARQVSPVEAAARLRLALLKRLSRRWNPTPARALTARTVFPPALDPAALHKSAPAELVKETLREAEAVMRGRFTLFAAVPLEAPGGIPDWLAGLPDGPRWRDDFSFDHRIDGGDGRDIRFTWELSRHGNLVALARAAFLTGEDRFRERLEALLADWIERNPFLAGPNWMSPLEVALRAISWVFIDDFAPVRDENRHRSFLETLWKHGVYLDRLNSIGINPSNHIIGEAAGLIVLATKFPGSSAARRWRALALRILEKEIRRQTYPSGASREHSVGYHRFVTGLFSLCLGVAGKGAFSEAFGSRLKSMYAFLGSVARPDGSFADFGDNDNAVALRLAPPAPHDVSRDIALGCALFGGAPEEADSGACPAAFWLLGSRAKECGNAGHVAPSSTLVEGLGLAILRSPEGNLQVEFDCGPQGFSPVSSHGHADALAVTVWHKGDRLIDPGTYRYNGAPDWRDAFRSSLFHNTVVIDGATQAQPATPFRWRTRADAHEGRVLLDDDFDYVEGVLDRSERRPWAHRREVIRLRDSLVIVIDRLKCPGAHVATANFHLGGAQATLEGATAKAEWDDGGYVTLAAAGAPSSAVSSDSPNAWRSPSYGLKEPSAVLSYACRFTDEVSLWWLMCFDESASVRVMPLERGDGELTEVRRGQRSVTFIGLPREGLAHTGDIRFAGRWLLVESEGGKTSRAWASDAWALETGGKRLFERFGGEPVALVYDAGMQAQASL